MKKTLEVHYIVNKLREDPPRCQEKDNKNPLAISITADFRLKVSPSVAVVLTRRT